MPVCEHFSYPSVWSWNDKFPANPKDTMTFTKELGWIFQMLNSFEASDYVKLLNVKW